MVKPEDVRLSKTGKDWWEISFVKMDSSVLPLGTGRMCGK